MSSTVTTKDVWAALPRVSLAEQITVVGPSANVLPDAGAQLTGRTPSTTSDAVGFVYVTIAPLDPVASTV